jgi:NADH-quinone oxidoreductase subunit N
VLTSVVSVFFYLRLVVMMYMTPADADAPVTFPAVPKIAGAALVVCAMLILYLGILPGHLLDWAAASVATIF